MSQRLKTELTNEWRGTSTSFLINSATICPLHSSFISLKYQLACSYSFFACVCVSTTCLESKLYILQCARSIGVTASENRAQKWMARHVNIISSQFRNYLSSPLKLHITKVPTCMFLLILCLCVCVSTTCLESKLYILQCARSIGVTASENRAQKWMARHVNIISNQFSNYLSSPLKLHMTKVPTCMFLLILCLCVCVCQQHV